MTHLQFSLFEWINFDKRAFRVFGRKITGPWATWIRYPSRVGRHVRCGAYLNNQASIISNEFWKYSDIRSWQPDLSRIESE